VLTFDPERHEYTLGGRVLPNVTRVLDPLAQFGGASPEVLEYARERGRRVHEACEADDLGTLVESTVDLETAMYLEGYRKFKRENPHSWDGIEERVYHPVHQYAGTLDRRGSIGGCRALVDIKSGAKQRTTALQTAAYLKAAFAGTWGEAQFYQRFALYLHDDGTYTLDPIETNVESDFRTFLSALNVFNWLHA
jgi:hypothetical protein